MLLVEVGRGELGEAVGDQRPPEVDRLAAGGPERQIERRHCAA
jgi:hypothetical protein